MILPIPLAEPTEAISRGEARARLGISLRDTLLLSVGRAVKYRPCGKDDFLSVINELLDQSPGTRAVIVGADESEMRAFLRKPLHPRCRLAGNVDDPQAFRIAADIYLESFPFGSQTALLEAGLAGLPVVLAPGPECAMLVANGRSITDCVDRPADQAEYVRHALRLIRDEGRRASLGATLRRSILSVHVGAAWRDSLADMYKCLDGIAHRPTRSGPEEWRSDADSAGLARWGVLTAAGEKYQPLLSNRGAVTRDLNVALAAKQVGRPEAAFVASARVLAQHWNVAASWRLFAGTCASAVASALRGLY